MGRWFRRPGSPVGHILGRMQAVDPLERRSIVRLCHRGVDREPPVRPFDAFCTHVQAATEGLVSAMRSSLVHARWRGARGCASKRPRPETTTSATKKDAWARPRAVDPPRRGTVVPVRQRMRPGFGRGSRVCRRPPALAVTSVTRTSVATMHTVKCAAAGSHAVWHSSVGASHDASCTVDRCRAGRFARVSRWGLSHAFERSRRPFYRCAFWACR